MSNAAKNPAVDTRTPFQKFQDDQRAEFSALCAQKSKPRGYVSGDGCVAGSDADPGL